MTKDQVFCDRVERAVRLYEDVAANAEAGFSVSEQTMISLHEGLVYPAMNRFSRMNRAAKVDHYSEFVRLCGIVALMQTAFEGRKCANPSCEEKFMPNDSRHIFCSKDCGDEFRRGR